jgi:DNA-binding response OmpR family regulator
MRILALEKTKADLDILCDQIREAFPGMACVGFTDPLLAIKSYLAEVPDFTVFGRDLRIMDGFMFARTIRKRYPNFTGLMIAENEEGRRDAENFGLAYLVKPVSALQIRNIRKELEEKGGQQELNDRNFG